MWKWTPWFQFYLVAGSFSLLGASTLTARLPFVLFGIGTILLTYFLARSLWMSRRAGLVAALLLVLSVPLSDPFKAVPVLQSSGILCDPGTLQLSEFRRGQKVLVYRFCAGEHAPVPYALSVLWNSNGDRPLARRDIPQR